MAKKEVKNNKDKTSFTKSFKAELKKVIWPTPKQLFNNTVAVLAIVLITAIIVFVLDITFESMNKYGINKVKEMVSNSATANETSNETTEENNVEQTENSEANVEENSTDTNNKIEDIPIKASEYTVKTASSEAFCEGLYRGACCRNSDLHDRDESDSTADGEKIRGEQEHCA